MQIDNDKCKRDREARLSSSRLDLVGLCGIGRSVSSHTQGRSSSSGGGLDSHGNSLSLLSPHTSSNNNSPQIELENRQSPQAHSNRSLPLTPTGNLSKISIIFSTEIV